MNEENKHLVVFPGAFDPLTNGHLDVIQRASALFDELIVAVGENPEKKSLLSQQVRAEIIREATAELANVSVSTYTGLTVDFAGSVAATAILRAIRDLSDLHREFQLAMTNRVVAGVETVFLLTSAEYAFTSSTLVKQIAQMGGDVSALVPRQVLDHIEELRKPSE